MAGQVPGEKSGGAPGWALAMGSQLVFPSVVCFDFGFRSDTR